MIEQTVSRKADIDIDAAVFYGDEVWTDLAVEIQKPLAEAFAQAIEQRPSNGEVESHSEFKLSPSVAFLNALYQQGFVITKRALPKDMLEESNPSL